MALFEKRPNIYSIPIAACLLVLIFVAELLLPMEANIGVLYAAPVALAARAQKSKIIVVAVLSTLLTLATLLGSDSVEYAWIIYFNKITSVAVIWITFMIVYYQNTYELLKQFESEANTRTRELDSQRNILYTLIDNMPLYVGIFNNQGRYSMVNKKYEDAFFMKREEIIGKRLRDIIPEENISTYEPMLLKALGGEEVEFYERTPMKNGSTIYAHGKYLPVFNAKREVEFVTVALFDVTKIEETRRALEIANETKNKIIGTIAHDIRNPINNFQSLLSAGSEAIISKEEFTDFVAKLDKQFEPIHQSIEELLRWSQIQLDGMEPNPTEINLYEVVSQLIESFQSQIESKSIRVTYPNKSSVMVFVDRVHISIILRNIIQNALKFTNPKGSISIDSQNLESNTQITVADTGIGMPKNAIRKIMSGQFVKSMTGTSNEKGTGLGLNLSYELIKKNKGSMQITSESNTGTIVNVTLPNRPAIDGSI